MSNAPSWYPKAVDHKLAIAIRLRRIGMKISVPNLARSVGISEFELQQFERAEVPIPLGRLALIADNLNSHPYDFFNPETIIPGAVFNPNTLELVRLYNSIKDPEIKRELLTAARDLTIKDSE